MKFIGFDIGTSLGWAVIEGGRRVESGQVSLQNDAWEGLGTRVARARQAARRLLERHPGAFVGIEQVLHSVQVRATQVWGAVLGGVAEACDEVGAGYSFANVTEVKVLATGEGNAKKEAMVRAAKARWGVDAGEDEADALFVAALVERRELDPTAPPLESLTDQRKRESKERASARMARKRAEAEEKARKAAERATKPKGAKRRGGAA